MDAKNDIPVFDVLYIGDYLMRRYSSPFHMSEIHVLSYLACVLSLYDKQPVADWGYAFLAKQRLPFSTDLQTIIATYPYQLFASQDQEWMLAPRGTKLLEKLLGFSLYKQRAVYLSGACSVLSVLSIGELREALALEPDLKSANVTKSERFLLEDSPALEHLYLQHEVIRSVVHNGPLFIAAVTWATSLATIACCEG